jgi:hypothetical protein
MKPCINCDEQTAFTVAAIGVDTEMCAPCFEANAHCCEWCGRLGADEDMQRDEVDICNECIAECQKEGQANEDAFYESLRMSDAELANLEFDLSSGGVN